MTIFRPGTTKFEIYKWLEQRSFEGSYSGFGTPKDRSYISLCTAQDYGSGTLLIFTRDSGMHSCGWWKNPQYERCKHLSLSFACPISGQLAPQNKKLAAEWCRIFFGDDRRKLWVEPPFSKDGRTRDVYHYRLFCDPTWRAILPKGEVYSKEFTEAGWQSWSDVNYEESKNWHLDT